MYHHVAAPPAGCPARGTFTYLDPARFAAQIAWLKRLGYQSAPVAHIAARLADNSILLPPRPVAITFDDGWLDVFTTAYPILSRAGFRATLFVAGGMLGRADAAFADSADKTPAPMMSAAQVRTLREAGWEIGNHTANHRRLGAVDEEAARREIVDGERILTDLLDGERPRVFAYPYGDFHAGVARLVASMGYLGACSTLPGRAQHPGDRLYLRRVPIARNMGTLRFLHCLRWRRYHRAEDELRRRLARDWPKA